MSSFIIENWLNNLSFFTCGETFALSKFDFIASYIFWPSVFVLSPFKLSILKFLKSISLSASNIPDTINGLFFSSIFP